MKEFKLDISNFERKVIYFVQKKLSTLLFIIITILALLMRNNLRYFQSGDYVYSKALDRLSGGTWRILGLKSLESNYNMPYLYILAFITYLPLLPLQSQISFNHFWFYYGISCDDNCKKINKNRRRAALFHI